MKIAFSRSSLTRRLLAAAALCTTLSVLPANAQTGAAKPTTTPRTSVTSPSTGSARTAPAVVAPTVGKPTLGTCSECGCRLASGEICAHCNEKLGIQAQSTVSSDMRMSGFVYTLDNDLQRNGIAVFRRQANGSLVPLPGSPFQAGGRGLSGGDIDEQGAIRVHGRYVLAVNPGSDSVAVMEKGSRGLLHVEGSPFPSGGSTPLSIAVHGNLVYVANQAAAFAGPKSLPNITGFRIGADGRLTPVPNSTMTFPAGQGPAQVEFSPNGQTLVATAGFQADNGSRIYSFRVLNEGRLVMGPGSPIEPQGAKGTVGFSWSPSGDRVYASLFNGSAVIPFAVDPATAAIRQAGEPIGDDQRAACWTAISADGQTLYVGNFVSNSISVYDVSAEGALTLLGSVPRRGATDKDTKDIELSKDGKTLYAVGSSQRQISIFRVESNRLLTELPSGQSPLTVATGQNITGLVSD